MNTATVPTTVALGRLPSPANHARHAPHPSVYELITQRIIALLEAGTIPWKKTLEGFHLLAA